MEYLADTADLEELERLFKFFPLTGVTTNPTILMRSGMKLTEAVNSIGKIIGDKEFHIQVMSQESDNIVREALKYKDYFELGSSYYTKIPITMEGLRAMSILKDRGINVTATAIFTQQQALIAARAGADYVAPYVSRLDNISSHGIDVVRDITANMHQYDLSTKVLAASFKTVDQLHRISMHGCHAATITPEMFMQLINHPMTDISINTFQNDGKGLYDVPF